MTARRFWNITFPILRNKYVLSLLVFGTWLLLFDQNNLVDRMDNMNTLKELEAEKVYFNKKIKEDQTRMRELVSDKKNLEKFAREQYLMKKDNEDIFVIVEDED